MKSKSSNSTPPLPQPEGPRGGLLYWLMPVAILVVAGIMLVLRESELLWRAQELSLWLPTELYWNTLMQYPGGAVSWLACYLTQYFYYPWLGTLIMCGLWLVICLLLAWEYRLRGPWLWLTVLVPLALLACVTQTGYWIYYQKLQGHLFVPTVGVLFAALCMAVPRLAESRLSSSSARWVRLGWLMIVCLAGYPFFGAWALGATALVASLPGTQPAPSWRGPVVITSFTLLLIGAIPQIYYQSIFEMTQRAYVYVAAMPSMRYSSDSFEIYRLPYYAIILAFVLIILASRYGKALAQRFASGAKSYMPAAVIIVLICLAVVGVKPPEIITIASRFMFTSNITRKLREPEPNVKSIREDFRLADFWQVQLDEEQIRYAFSSEGMKNIMIRLCLCGPEIDLLEDANELINLFQEKFKWHLELYEAQNLYNEFLKKNNFKHLSEKIKKATYSLGRALRFSDELLKKDIR